MLEPDLNMDSRTCGKKLHYMITFPTTYIVDSGFIRAFQILSKARNLLEITRGRDLGLCLTCMDPNLEKLAKMPQGQGPRLINLFETMFL